MKYFYTFVFSFFCFTSFAQNYLPFQSNRDALFVETNGSARMVKAIHFDSIVVNSMDSIYYNYKVVEGPGLCYNPHGNSWLGEKVILKPNGDVYFFNSNSDSLLLKTQSTIGDKWKFMKKPDGSYYEAFFSSHYFSTVLGNTDLIKEIIIQYYDSLGNALNSRFNGTKIKIGQNYGIVEMLNVYRFETTFLTPIGLKLIGKTNPIEGIYLKNKKEFLEFNIGDIFRLHKNLDFPSNFDFQHTDILHEVLTKQINGDTIDYTIQECTKTQHSWVIDTTSYSSTNNSKAIINFRQIINPDKVFDALPEQAIFFPLSPTDSFFTNNAIYQHYDFNGNLLYNGRLIKYSPYIQQGMFQQFDSCWIVFPYGSPEREDYYIDGCGKFYYKGKYGQEENKNLVYFKKGTETWGYPTHCDSLVSDETQKLKLANVKIYPNPSNGILRIEHELIAQNYEILIYDLTGKKCFRADLSQQEYDLSVLEPAVYILMLYDKNKKEIVFREKLLRF